MFQQNLTRSWYVTGPEWGDFRVVLPLCSVRSLQNRSDILGHKSTLVTANRQRVSPDPRPSLGGLGEVL